MEVEASPGGSQCMESQLTQNSQITVTIDDLTEGLIVVSFTHSTNLYQGVLFQLNRERGIPSGISFAKEHVLGTSSLEKCESDPSQITPLSQRHSYNNQGNCHGASHTPISQPSLRRIIKPPARFKNARMSLRLRARPVLCAKCRSLCDDKSDGGKDEPSKDEHTTDKTKKDRPKGPKEPGNPIQGPTSLEMRGKLMGSETCPRTTTIVDPKDLCYDSVGSTRVVENYWRRPLVKPLIPSTEETYARLRKHKAPSENSREPKRKVKASSGGTDTAPTATSSGSDPLSVKAYPETNGIFVTKSNVCDSNFPNTRSRKALNLKMCITKIAEMRKGEEKKKKGRVKQEEPLRIQSPVYQHSDSSLESVEASEAKLLAHEKTSSDECSAGGGQRTRASSKKSKAWENRIRTKSTVPVRFRDESYLTKNIFNFNKRRPLANGGDIPVLTICRSDDENTFKVATLVDSESIDATVTTSKVEEDTCDAENEQIPVSTVQSCTPSPPPPKSNEDADGIYSPSSSSHVVPPPLSIKPNIGKPTELIKTPTIKITFGSSGNGMVVQIPPKITEPLATDLKAVRKAMKKAKKEAKRRRSISPQLSPSSHALSPDNGHLPERSNPPSPSALGEMDVAKERIPDSDQLSEHTGFRETRKEPSTSLKNPKKKKKQKKRRRNSRVFKENDGFTSSSSSHEPVPYATSSPHSTSTFCTDRADDCPSDSSVKSCNQLDSSGGLNPLPPYYKDSCPHPRRRRSMPATSTTSNPDAPRVCINLKRIDTNAYVPLPLHNLSSHSDNEEPSSLETNGTDAEDGEINDFPVDNITPNGSNHDMIAPTGESVEFYKDKETECSYRKGDIVWGKLPACPWWPGKIDDILAGNGEETCAKVSWYKSTTQSCMRFKMLVPFAEYFDSKYARSRRRGLYQHAVKDALVEAHKLNPGTSPSD